MRVSKGGVESIEINNCMGKMKKEDRGYVKDCIGGKDKQCNFRVTTAWVR